MLDLKHLTIDVCQIAKEAGSFLRNERLNFTTDCVAEKHAHDYVTYVDKASEEFIVNALRRLLPEAGFITEEGSAVYEGETYCWVVDPLDGTTNYIHNNPPYCVSIALRNTHEVLLGVVYEVSCNECFYAWKEGGAYVNGKPMHVSATLKIENAFLVTELPYNSTAYKQTALHLINHLYGLVAGIRMNGSAALALCYVAAGRFDGWLEAFIGRWDHSAATLMIKEAGGTVTDLYGNENYIDSHHILATNGALHPYLLELISQKLPLNL